MFSRSLLTRTTLPTSSSSALRIVQLATPRSQRFASSTGSGEPVTPSPKNEPSINKPIIFATVLGLVAAAFLMNRGEVHPGDGGVSAPKSALANAVTSSAPDAKKPVSE